MYRYWRDKIAQAKYFSFIKILTENSDFVLVKQMLSSYDVRHSKWEWPIGSEHTHKTALKGHYCLSEVFQELACELRSTVLCTIVIKAIFKKPFLQILQSLILTWSLINVILLSLWRMFLICFIEIWCGNSYLNKFWVWHIKNKYGHNGHAFYSVVFHCNPCACLFLCFKHHWPRIEADKKSYCGSSHCLGGWWEEPSTKKVTFKTFYNVQF